MTLIEKLTDEEVDEMIPETDVDDTQCSEQLADVSAQIADSGSCHSTPQGRIPERAVAQIVNMSRHTQWWRLSSQILSPHAASGANAQDAAKSVSRQDPVKQPEIIRKTVQRKNPNIHEIDDQSGE